MLDLEQVKKDAEAELAQEQHREAVEKQKERLRQRQNLWVKIFPWRIRIERRELPHPVPKKDRFCRKCSHWNCDPEFCRNWRKQMYGR